MQSLYDRYTQASAYKDRWLALYKQLYWYVIPDRDAFNVKFNYDDQGRPVTQQVWDNTAVLGAYQRANDLHALLMPKDRVWGKFALDPHKFQKEMIEQSQKQVDEMNDRIFFYINQSNLARVVSSSNLDLIGGTGVIWVESQSDEVPLYFRSIPAVATFLEYSSDDVIKTLWFVQKATGRSILEDFPNYRGRQRSALEGNPNITYTVIYGQIKLSEDKFYIYAVLADDPLIPLFETERPYQQIILYRDRVRPGEAEGRGVGTDLLPTITDLNRMVMYRSNNFAFKGNPPLFYESSDYFNPWAVRQWSGAMIPKSPGGRNPIEAMQMPEYPDVLSTIQDLRNVIMKGFQVDPLGEINEPVKTATEISIRENRAQRTSATDISRLINEQSLQIYEVSARILNSRNLLLANRQDLPRFNTKVFRFHFQSPLYDLQNESDINHFVSNMQIKQQFMGEGLALASLDIAETNEFLNTKLNLPAKLFRDRDQLKEVIENMVQQAGQQQLPQPSTGAAPVTLPQNQGVTI